MGIYGFIFYAVLVYVKYSEMVAARGLLFLQGAGELGITTIEPSKKFKLSQPTTSISAKQGDKIAADLVFQSNLLLR